MIVPKKWISLRLRNQIVSRLLAAKRCAVSEVTTRPPIIISGEGRSGTTWLAEAISDAVGGRLVFEPLWYEFTYRRIRRYGPGILHEGMHQDFLNDLSWVFEGALPYNHYVDRFCRMGKFNVRVVKELRLNHCLQQVHQCFPDFPIIHIVRHPFDSVRSQLELKLEGQLEMSRRYNELLITNDYLRSVVPWLNSISVDRNCISQMKVFAWAVSHYMVYEAVRSCKEILIVRYEDLRGNGAAQIDRIGHFLEQKGYGFKRSAPNLRRPSGTTIAKERDTVILGQPAYKSEGYFENDTRRRLVQILQESGLLGIDGVDAFGQRITGIL